MTGAGHLRHAEPGADARRGRPRHQAVHARPSCEPARRRRARPRGAGARDDLRERLLTPTLASALANAIEARDSYLHGHCERLAPLAVRIAAELLGLRREGDRDDPRSGRSSTTSARSASPTACCSSRPRSTTRSGGSSRRTPRSATSCSSRSTCSPAARPIVRHHHERWDGAGYPDGLAARASRSARASSRVADSVEVMSARRSTARPCRREEIVRELERGRGTQWDPTIVDHVLKLVESGAISFAPDGLVLAESPPGAAVLRFPGPKARRHRHGHIGEAAQ